jgi:hypothetical protein
MYKSLLEYAILNLRKSMKCGFPIINGGTKLLSIARNALLTDASTIDAIEIISGIWNNPTFYFEYSEESLPALVKVCRVDGNLFTGHYYDMVMIEGVYYMKLDYLSAKYFVNAPDNCSRSTARLIRYGWDDLSGVDLQPLVPNGPQKTAA